METPIDDFDAALHRTLLAGARALSVRTTEERRITDRIERCGERLEWPVHVWSAASGVDRDARPLALLELLTMLRDRHDDGLWVVLDAAAWLDDPKAARLLRELAQRIRGPTVILVDPPRAPRIGGLLDRIPEIISLTLSPPGAVELADRVHAIARALAQQDDSNTPAELDAAAQRLAAAGLGLGADTFDRVIAEAIVAGGIDADAIERFIRDRKPATLDQSGLLTPIEPLGVEHLGGLDHLKRWLRRRALALGPQARAVGIASPRGILLLGVQGCGKSLAARVCADVLGLALVRLEPGRLFGGTVGESEGNLRYVTEVAEQMAPVVVWIDELDKGFAGTGGEQGDAGTSARVLGGLLTWLQERRRPVFVVATANRVDAVPPELLRRGRLDEIFFVDLPDAATRTAILRVHLEVVPQALAGGPPPLASPWSAFAEVVAGAEGYSGAEIESALVEARLAAFADGRPLAATDLARALAESIPLSVARAETVQELRTWAKTRARPA